MLQAHPKVEKICKLHKICFVALVASYTPLILGSDNMRILSHQNFLYKAGSVVGVFATFATLVVGIIPWCWHIKRGNEGQAKRTDREDESAVKHEKPAFRNFSGGWFCSTSLGRDYTIFFPAANFCGQRTSAQVGVALKALGEVKVRIFFSAESSKPARQRRSRPQTGRRSRRNRPRSHRRPQSPYTAPRSWSAVSRSGRCTASAAC